MRIGMRGHDFGAYPANELVDLYIQHGVQAVQLAIPKAIPGINSYFDVDDRLLDSLSRALSAADIGVAVLGCYIEPALEDGGERRKNVELFKRGIECAAALGAGCIGTETTNYIGDAAGRDKAFDRLSKSLDAMLIKAQSLNVLVAVEPVMWHTLNSPEMVERLERRFQSPNLVYIFDPVNLLHPAVIDTQQMLWQECLQAFGEKIMAVHIKDAKLENGHMVPCPLGEGDMDYSAVIAPWLQSHKPDVALLREETSLVTVRQDFDWIQNTFIKK